MDKHFTILLLPVFMSLFPQTLFSNPAFAVPAAEIQTPPIAEAGGPVTLTCAEPTATLDGSGSSQGPNFTYLWTFVPPPGGGTGGIVSGETTLTPEVNENGLYFLTVTDTTNGCTAVDSVAVGIFASFPNVQTGPADTLTCAQQQLTLSATASTGAIFTYLWTTPDGNIVNGETTLAPVIDAPGAYLLTVTNTQNGCTSLDVVVVAEDVEIPVSDAGQSFQLSCDVTNAMLDGTGSSAGPGFTYLWTTANGSFTGGIASLTPGIDAPGTYTLTVTNTGNGCIASDLVVITQDANTPMAHAGTTGFITCNQPTVTLDGSGSSSGPGFSYLWTTQDGNILSGATTLAPVVDTPGTYLLAVTNSSNNCQSMASVMVFDFTQMPTVSIGAPQKLTCIDTTAMLNATASGGSSLIWNWAGPGILSGETTPAPLVSAAGTYTVTVTNQQNGCTATAATTVTEDTIPPGATASADTITCKELEVALTGSSPTLNVNYHWTTQDGHFIFGETTPTPGVDATGTYTLTVTNPVNGCTSTASVTVVEVLLEDFVFEIKNPDCVTGVGSIVFTQTTGGTPPYRYSIDGGASFSTEPVFENLAPGVYDLEVKDDENCKLTGTAVLAEPPAVTIDLDPMVTLYLGDAWQMDPQLNVSPNTLAEIEWTPADGLSCTDCLRPELTPLGDAVFTLKITDVNGCTATASTAVTVLRRLDVYIPNAFSPNGDGINDVLVIFAKANQVAVVRSFKIFTRWGESVFVGSDFQPNDPAHGWDGMHRGRRLDAGVYVWFAEVELLNGERVVLKGDVVLVR